MTDLPSPLVAADVDLRGMPFIPLDIVRLFDSDLYALSTGDEFKAALTLWGKSFLQVPAASLPADDRILAHLSGAGFRWRKVKAMALRGWVKCSDGRLYHPVVAEKALEAWEDRVKHTEMVEHERDRKRREREGRSKMFDALRERGITPPWNTRTDELRRLVTDSSQVPVTDKSHAQVTDLSRGQAPDSPETVTAKTVKGQGQGKVNHSETIVSGGKPPPATPAEIIFGYGVPMLTNAGTAEKQARSFLGGLRKSHGDAAVIDKLRECMRAKPLQPLEWLAKALPPSGPSGTSKQTQLETRNAAVVAGWVPPEMRQQEVAT